MSRGGQRNLDAADFLELATQLLNLRLDDHQASLLCDLVLAATEDRNALDAPCQSPTCLAAANTTSTPPSYASQPALATPSSASIFLPRRSCHRHPVLVGGAASTPASLPVVTPPPALAVSSQVPAPVPVATPSPVAPPVVPNVAFPATNNGYPPYHVLPVGFSYITPAVGTPGPFYAITRGRVVGVVAGWDKASPLCIGVGGAVFRSVPSIDAGKQVVDSALSAGSCMILS
ncbi:hypothetical protein BDZ89DRAFT_1047070 [Hymenopellis radicata]|nr:hypothetical protein BDZ89DRAFT_1047070 [Hymenopellis radicata]